MAPEQGEKQGRGKKKEREGVLRILWGAHQWAPQWAGRFWDGRGRSSAWRMGDLESRSWDCWV